jgi:DNA-binding response OmpR family regulator
LLRGQAYLGGALEEYVRRQQVDGLLQGGPFIVDLRRGQAAVRDGPIHLTPTEFAALKLFLERPGQLLTPEEIEMALWPGEIAPDPERARGVVKKLRAALGPAGEAIVNRRGQGYLLLV